ncbi:glycoside hydrolase family 27 protein [Streptomyces sp. NPDC096324]|uniref:glycoside hydrolase family 27 protein n=1 Tax=Streptomyces sp. NPDC096324 TaxID=3366085 RepID=UPI003806B213
MHPITHPATSSARRSRRRTLTKAATAAALSLTAVLGTATSAGAAVPPDDLNKLYAASLTPYMGWNTWYGRGVAINQSVIRAEADALVNSGLAAAGFKTVWLDDGWWSGSRDASGKITVSSTQWPTGMNGLADYIHSKGLKVGIYTDAGYNGCGGANKGSAGHVQQDINTFAAWGYDAVKIDHCGGNITGLNDADTYATYRHAILNNSSARPMVFNICAWGYQAYQPVNSNAWRTDFDIAVGSSDGSYVPGSGAYTYAKVLRNLDTNSRTPTSAGPGHWNDPDYLLTGHNLDGLPTSSTDAASRSQFSMWAMMAAPLIIGTRATTLSPASLATLTNAEVIAVDQDARGSQGVKIADDLAGGQVWSKRLTGSGTRAIALFNRSGTGRNITASFSAAGLRGTIGLRDLWTHTNLSSVTTGSYTAYVPPYATVVLKATGTEAS